MSIKSELTVLKTNIQNAKNKLYSNLTDKGVTTITTASTLDAMADSVSNITVGEGGSEGGNSFSVIGYTSTPQYIQDGIDYAQTIYDNWDATKTNRSQAFSGDTQLVYFPLVDTSNVTKMNQMFSDCTNLEYVPPLNTSNVTNMSMMFEGCSNLISLDLSNWDTSNVVSICDINNASASMFSNCIKLKKIIFPSKFVTNKINCLRYLFENCESLTSLDLSSFDTSNVTTMNRMFYNCSGLASLDLTPLDTSNVTDMGGMFEGCSGLTSLDLSGLDTSNVTDMGGMFYYCSGLTSLDLSGLDTSKVTDMGSMFNSCSGLTSLDLSSFDTSNVTDMGSMFYKCNSLASLDLSSFNTSNVTDMGNMFYKCSGLTSLDLSGLDTSNVTNMGSIFDGCNNLNKVDGYISFKSYSSSTMNQYYIMGYSKQTKLRKLTFKDIGYHSNAKQFNMSYATVWGVNNDTITDARQSLIDSLITYSYDRATASYATCTVTLAADTKAVLTDDEIAAITAKGFTIA